MYLSRPPDALKSLIRLYVGLRTGYDLGYIAFCIQIKLFCSISSLLEPQSKSWIVELELELSAPRELTQSCGSDSAFRKGLFDTIEI